ncbi:MAG TPA: sigma-70 family RNA polymerase sigma factor [Bacteroidota bacterium]|nr:sigma-70 family RNA polymerase sigma factor [Bacteroidota bacterium]
MNQDDRELIQQAQRGNLVAFEQLVHRYDKRVLSMAALYVSSAEDAKDIYQEVFLRVYRALPRFELKSEFSTWLYRITTNVCLTHRARRKRHSHTSLDQGYESDEDHTQRLTDTLTDGGMSDQAALDSEITAHIETALNELSPKQKMVFTMRHYQGYKLKEIAEIMNCTEGTVKKYLFTATQRLREQLRGVFE